MSSAGLFNKQKQTSYLQVIFGLFLLLLSFISCSFATALFQVGHCPSCPYRWATAECKLCIVLVNKPWNDMCLITGHTSCILVGHDAGMAFCTGETKHGATSHCPHPASCLIY